MMVDVPAVLDVLGVVYTEHNNEANSLCPVHERMVGKADNSPSWWINLDTGAHLCFSCGYKGNILHLICDLQEFYEDTPSGIKYDFTAARGWLSTITDVPIETIIERLKSLKQYVTAPPQMIPMNEARLAVFVDPPKKALEARGLDGPDAQFYGVKWQEDTQRWILPLREPHTDVLMGWQEKGSTDRYFRNRPLGLHKSKTLFGVSEQVEELVIVVESPLDVLRIAAAYKRIAVAICGAAPSEDQIKLLQYSKRIIVALDNDQAGKKGCDTFLKAARKYGLNLAFFNYGSSSAKDPGDMNDEQILWGIENAISSIYGEHAYVSRDSKTLSS
jgi:hypothetical protein